MEKMTISGIVQAWRGLRSLGEDCSMADRERQQPFTLGDHFESNIRSHDDDRRLEGLPLMTDEERKKLWADMVADDEADRESDAKFDRQSELSDVRTELLSELVDLEAFEVIAELLSELDDEAKNMLVPGVIERVAAVHSSDIVRRVIDGIRVENRIAQAEWWVRACELTHDPAIRLLARQAVAVIGHTASEHVIMMWVIDQMRCLAYESEDPEEIARIRARIASLLLPDRVRAFRQLACGTMRVEDLAEAIDLINQLPAGYGRASHRRTLATLIAAAAYGEAPVLTADDVAILRTKMGDPRWQEVIEQWRQVMTLPAQR